MGTQRMGCGSSSEDAHFSVEPLTADKEWQRRAFSCEDHLQQNLRETCHNGSTVAEEKEGTSCSVNLPACTVRRLAGQRSPHTIGTEGEAWRSERRPFDQVQAMFTQGAKETTQRLESDDDLLVSTTGQNSACGSPDHSPDPCTFCLECIDDHTEEHTLSCGHSFHKGCFRKYVEFCAMEAGRGKLLRCPLCRETLEDFRLATVGFEQARVLLTDASRCRQAGVRTGLVRHTQVASDPLHGQECLACFAPCLHTVLTRNVCVLPPYAGPRCRAANQCPPPHSSAGIHTAACDAINVGQVSEASVMSLQCPPANEGQGEPYDETTRLPRLPPRRVGGLRRNVTVLGAPLSAVIAAVVLNAASC